MLLSSAIAFYLSEPITIYHYNYSWTVSYIIEVMLFIAAFDKHSDYKRIAKLVVLADV